MTDPDAAQFWESRYADESRVWSGRPNQVLVEIAGELSPGRAVDLGCGEGADAIWLAERGWEVTGVDIAPTAIRRAESAARERGVPPGRIRLIVGDLAAWATEGGHDLGDDLDAGYDLVAASFLQSWFDFPRTEILRRAADLVAMGGHLLVVTHAEPPPWADHPEDHVFPTPEDDLRDIAVSADAWDVVLAETRSRDATGPDGAQYALVDGIVLVRRR